MDGEVNPDAAWYYPNPSPLARKIKDHLAFWNGVVIEGQPEATVPGRYGPPQIVRGLWL